MARDLIPPPSPAGRPEPDGGGSFGRDGGGERGHPRLIELPPEPAARPAAVAPPTARQAREPIGPSRFRTRFGFIGGALVGVVIAALVVLVVALTGPGAPQDPGLAANWSAWQPADDDATSGAAEIAAHVAPHYRLDDGDQIVAVTGGPLEIQSIPLGVAVVPATGNIRLVRGSGVLYTLNGLGPSGSILSGAKSKARHLLLRREALELALYSFRYLHVDMVVTLLPPPKPDTSATATAAMATRQALFFRPGDLASELQVPLGITLAGRGPFKPAALKGDEARRVNSLTLSNLFNWSVQQAQDTKAYIVLTR